MANLGNLFSGTLSSAIEENLEEQYHYFGRAPDATVYSDATVAWFVSGIPIEDYNGVSRMRLAPEIPEDEVIAAIEHIVKPFRERDLSMLWWVGPSTQPANLGVYLAAAGLAPTGSAPGMAISLATLEDTAPAPSELTIQRVGSLEALRQWVYVAGAGYGEPESVMAARFRVHAALELDADRPLQRYLALLRGEPVGMASLFLGAGVAGIYDVAVVPAARRQGIGAALTRAPLVRARDQGYQIGVLVATPMGEPLYRRLGFQPHCSFHHYRFQP